MMKLQVTGLKETIKYLEGLAARELPFALSLGLNRTAQAVKQELIGEMDRVFDRPTPYVKGGLYISPATKTDLVAEVGLKDTASREQAARTLGPHIYGGGRQMKRSEQLLGRYYAPGGGVRLDRYGNMSAGQVTQVLSGLKKLADPAQWTTPTSRVRNKKPRGYFMLRSPHGKLTPGVWEKYGTADNVRPIMAFIKSPSYRAGRYDFHGVARRVALSRAVPFLKAAIEDVLVNHR
jgi:hypothetical protein